MGHLTGWECDTLSQGKRALRSSFIMYGYD
jgi:hypothetical protein